MHSCNKEKNVSPDSLTSRLRKMEWRVTRIHGEFLKAHGVNMYQAMSLIYIAAYGETETVNQRSIEKYLYLSNPGVSKIINSLEQAGYVCRVSDPADARSHRLIVTEAGARFADELNTAINKSDQKILSPLSAEEQAQMLSLLEKIGEAQAI